MIEQSERRQLRYAWYVVCVLTLCYTLSFIDRTILSFLVGPIKHDLGVSDTRIGQLLGFAFALFYTFLGLPMGWLADRYHRGRIIAAGIVCWSIMTAVCAATTSYIGLFLARMGVGIGEAALAPSAFSLIADYFPKNRLSRALSLYSVGVFGGSGIALLAGGLIVHAVSGHPPVTVPLLGTIASWRLTFLIVGLPGVLVALWVLLLREPVRKDTLRAASGADARLSLAEIVRHALLRWQSIIGLGVGMGLIAFCNYGLGAWAPTLLQRLYGWGPGRAGPVLGLITVVFGCLGLAVGGLMTDRWQSAGVRAAPIRTCLISAIGGGIAITAALASDSVGATLALLAPANFFLALPTGASYAAVQAVLPNQVRGQVSAVFLLCLNLIGAGLGPFFPGYFSNHLFHDEQRIGSAMLVSFLGATVLASVIFAAMRGAYRRHHALMQP